MESGKKRRTLITAVFLWGAVALGVFFWFRTTRLGIPLLQVLPPGADVYALVDLPSLETNPAVRRLLSDPPFAVDEEYKRFVEATGFRYQDHLKQLALAKLGPDWVGSARIVADRERVVRYMESQGAGKLSEGGQTIFVFGRTRPLRLILLERDLVIFAIGANENLIRQALQRYQGTISESGASEVKRTGELARLPSGSSLWVVGRVERLFSQEEWLPRLGPFAVGRNLFRGSRTLYVSVRSGLTQLDFQVEDRCDSAATAERLTQTLQGMLALVRAMPPDPSEPSQAKLQALLAGISVQQVADSVLAQWQWNADTLRQLQAVSPQEN